MNKTRMTDGTLRERYDRWAPAGGPDECWVWTGPTNGSGYGQITFKSVRYSAPKLAYVFHYGMIAPEDLKKDVCHTCDTPACVNWKHLWLGTRSQNMRDAVLKGRISRLILEKMGTPEQHEARRLKIEKLTAEREARRLIGGEKGRDADGRFCFDGVVLEPRERDAFGRMIKPGAAPLPPRERDSRGFFIKRQP